METITIQQQKEKCPICGEFGTIHPIEILPKNGIALECIHNNIKENHRWAQYDSLDSMITIQRRTNPRIINCPACHKRGRVNHYFLDKSRIDLVSYYVIHEKIGGTWGKTKIPKQRRCYITDPEHREAILKKLGRYIRKEGE